jgi:septal ring factor EnvC (AmiA/AmiB activator)
VYTGVAGKNATIREIHDQTGDRVVLDEDTQKLHLQELIRLERAFANNKKFDFGNLTALAAVGGMVLSITNSWAVTAKRLDYLEQTMSTIMAKADRVPQLEVQLSELTRTLARMETTSTVTDGKVNEIHDTLIKLGMNLKVPVVK